MDLNFDKDDLRDAIIDRAVSEMADINVHEMVRDSLRSKIDDQVRATINNKVDELLTEAMREALNESLTPVNTWGEPVGEPTTLKQVIHTRAKDFWNQKVNGEGKATSYGEKARWEHLLGDELQKAFSECIKQDMVNIAGALKDAVRKDFHDSINSGLNRIFKVKSLGDKSQ